MERPGALALVRELVGPVPAVAAAHAAEAAQAAARESSSGTGPLAALLEARAAAVGAQLGDEGAGAEDGEPPEGWQAELARLCLRLLRAAKQELLAKDVDAPPPTSTPTSATNPTAPAGLLGMADRQALSALVEFAVVFSIAPWLSTGVGVPLPSRLGKHTRTLLAGQVVRGVHEGRLYRAVQDLAACVLGENSTTTTDTTTNSTVHKGLKDLVLRIALVDMVAALSQLAYGPVPSVPGRDAGSGDRRTGALSPADTPQTACAKLATATADERLLPAEGRAACGALLHRLLFEAVGPRAAFDCLFSVMRSNGSGTPSWLRGCCHILVAQTLMRPDGLPSLLAMVLKTPDATRDSSRLWELCDRTAQMVARCPRQTLFSEAEYYSAVSPQVLEVLRLKQAADSNNSLAIRTAAEAVSRMARSAPEAAGRYLLRPLCAPLWRCFHTDQGAAPDSQGACLSAQTELVSEAELGACVQGLHRIVVVVRPSPAVLKYLGQLLGPLFDLHCFAANSKSHLARSVADTLEAFLKLVAPQRAAFELCKLLLPDPARDPHVVFGPGGTGGAALRSDEHAVRDGTDQAAKLVALVQTVALPAVASRLFTLVLDRYGILLPGNQPQAAGDASAADPTRHVVLMHALAMLCEEVGPDIVRDVPQAIKFVGVMLHHDDPDTVLMSLSLLDTLLSGAVEIREEHVPLLGELLDPLEPLTAHGHEQVAGLAAASRTSIATRDPRWAKYLGSGAQDSSNGREDGSNAALAEVLQQLRDPLLPVRGHALITLRRLVLDKHPATVRNVRHIMALFRSQLADRDSYLYLTAINGLTALGDVHPADVIPLLVAEFEDSQLPTELRLKLGEALTKVARQCGEVLPKYAPLFLNPLFRSVKDPDETVRASSLANLAAVCSLLQYSLQQHVTEVAACVSAVLQSDSSPEVRRGAVNVITETLGSLGQRSFEVLGGDGLRQFYRLVRRTEETDPDEVTRYHARRALGELDHIMRAFLFPGRLVPKVGIPPI